MTKEIKIVPKLSLKEIIGLKRNTPKDQVVSEMRKHAESSTQIASIIGDVEGYGVKATQYGESIFLAGLFIARNEINGDIFKSDKIYLPKNAVDNIVAKFKGRTGPEDKVKFQLGVRVVEDSASATGYTYICEPVRTPEIVSREQEMLEAFNALPPPANHAALPAPESNKKAGNGKPNRL